jgi:acetolactate synthase-1/2/3 large subunit
LDKIVPVDLGAEAFVELLNANGVEYIFLSPGSDTVCIQEALSKFEALGKRTPRVVLGLHESVSMAAAHGYYMVSGRPQVVIVHVDVGTQQVGGALHNAQRARVGVILCAGRAPISIDEDKKYGRNSRLGWITEQFDQAGVVRGYVKWDYELRSNENIHHVVQRAFQVASTEPCGPVYLILPRELLMEEINSVMIPDVVRYAAPSTPQADINLLEKAAEMLVQAENPLIITDYAGRHHEAVASLIELAETLGVRVITSMCNMSFPTTHRLWGGFSSEPYLKDVDVILIIDHDAPYAPSRAKLAKGAKIIQIDMDPVKENMPIHFFPVDILIEADSSKAIPALTGIVKQKLTTQQQSILQDRSKRLEGENRKLIDGWYEIATSKAYQKPIAQDWLCRCIAEEIDENTIVVNEVAGGLYAIVQHIPRVVPGTYFNTYGSSLGWGPGAALGAKLAAPDRTVVHLAGDGSFIYGCPTAALWAANRYGAPHLTIVFNNGEYRALRGIWPILYGGNSYSEKTGNWVGVDFTPCPDYSLIAQACGSYAQRVEEPSELRPAIREALEKVRNGQNSLLDVIIA